MNIIKATAIAVLVLIASVANAEIIPPPGRTDPRIREVAYDPNNVVRLVGYVGYDIHLQFSKGESFLGVGSGDSGGIDIGSNENDIWIKPIAPVVRTNIDVKTNKHIYHLDYAALKKPPKNRRGMIYSVKFRYPDVERLQRAKSIREARLRQMGGYTGYAENRNYWYCGSKSMKPLETYDNGIQTRIRFAANAEFPAIYVLNEDETESLVNFNVEENEKRKLRGELNTEEVVIHRMAQRLVLRRGNLVGCIENRSFSGGGKKLSTQTVSKDISRELKQNPETSDATAE